MGIVAVANRAGGYSHNLPALLAPFCSTCATIIDGYRNAQRRLQAEEALHKLNDDLECRVQERTAELRALLASWRRFHGVESDPGLAAAAKASARQAALLTGPWRLNLQLDGQAPWQYTAQVLPRQLLAASHLTELAWLGRQRKPGLRGASTFALAVPGQLLLLALFDRKVRVRTPPELRGPPELRAAVELLQAGVLASGSFGDAAAALEEVPAHLRAMALTQFDQPEAELEFA